MEYFRPGDNKVQTSNTQRAGNEVSAEPSTTRPSRSASTRSSSHDTKSHRLSRHMDYDDVSETSSVSMSSTKASTGSAPPSSTSNGSSHQSASLRPSRTSKSASTARPSVSNAAVPARPTYGLEQEQYRPQLSHSVTAPAYQRPASMYASTSQPSIFGSQHGIREAPVAPQPPPVSSSSSRSVPPPSANPFSSSTPSLDHLGLAGSMGPPLGQTSMQVHMPGAFPAESTAPYRRPTDLTTQLSMSNSNISMDHYSSDNIWDSEGDSASCLSVSTTATSVASDITEKGETYNNITPTQTASSSRTTTPSHALGQEQPQSRSVTQTPRPSILRHTGPKSILSNGSKESSSSSSVKTMSSNHSSKTYTSTPSSSATRSSTGTSPHIHIEVNRSDSRQHRDDLRNRQAVEDALVDKIAQLKLEQSQAKSAKTTPAPAPVAIKRVPSVRFAEPEKTKVRTEEKPAAPTFSDQEKNLSKELVQQTKEVQKLELEIEKSKLQAKEKERAELERKLKEEAAELERKKEHERQLKQLQKEKAELEKASKEREKAEKEREKATKEREKADKEREKARQKERQQVDKKLSDIEKAQREHDKLQESFIDQGKILADLKTRFDAQAKTLEATEAERAGLQKIKDEFERRCADLSKTLSHVSDKERFVVEQVASLQIIKESLQGRVGPLEARVSEQEGEIGALRGERDGLYQDVKSYLLRITEVENGMKGLVEEKHAFIVKVGELEKAKSGLEDQVKDRDGQIASLTGSLEARAKETQEHIASLREEHRKQIEGLEAAKDALISGLTVGHQLQVQDLEEQITVLNVHIDGAHADVDNFKKTIKSLEDNLSEEKSKVDEEKSKTGAEQARADSLASERDTLLTQLDGHKLLAVDQEKDLLDLRSKLAGSEGQLARLQESSKNLEAEHEELQKRAASLEEQSKATAPAPAEPAPVEEQPPAEKAPAPETIVVETEDAGLEAQVAATKTELEGLQAQNQELTTKTAGLEAKNAELAAQVETTKTELGTRITELEGERDTAASALVVAQVELSHARAIADRVPALEEEAAKVPGLTADKAGLEAQVADLEAHASQVPGLRGECARLAEQLAAANKLIEGLTAAHEAGLNSGYANAIPLPQSPPPPRIPSPQPSEIPIPPSPGVGPAPPAAPSVVGPPPSERRKVRSRAPSMARSVSSRASAVSKKSSGGVRDDIALVMVRDAKDRGNVTVVRKSSTTFARALTVGILLSCAAFGAYGTFGAAANNGLLDSLGRSVGSEAREKQFLGGPVPYKTTYTGLQAIDDTLIFLVAFFVVITDGPTTWDVKIVYWCLLAEFSAAWAFIKLEGHRGGNRGRIVSWTGTFGLILQNITFTITVPIYFIIHLLSSPTSSSNPTPDDLAVDSGDSGLLPLRTALSFILPATLMNLPSPSVLSAKAHYTWQAIWQIFPIAHTVYDFIPWSGSPNQRNVSAAESHALVARAQNFILYLCFIPRTAAILIALTPASLAPGVMGPALLDQLTLESLFVPYWPWNSPAAGDPASPAGKPELVKLFLQWDVYCGGLAILAWATYAYLAALPNRNFVRDVVPKALAYGVLGGPVAVATTLLMERDAAVVGRI
ncbi:hypothetical protein diail_7673, partial [Diaporthe ilicicola]